MKSHVTINGIDMTVEYDSEFDYAEDIPEGYEVDLTGIWIGKVDVFDLIYPYYHEQIEEAIIKQINNEN